MPRIERRSVLLCDMSALTANYAAVRACLPSAAPPPICVLKANAYGHGAAAIAAALYAVGARQFAVSEIDEALPLAELLPGAEILVLGYTPPEAAPYAAERDIVLTVPDEEIAKSFSHRLCGRRLKIHLKLNSGMNRTGFLLTPEAFDGSIDAILRVAATEGLCPTGIYSHMATADEGFCPTTARQLSRFRAAVAALARRGVALPAHLSASAGIALGGLGFPRTRVGLALFGYSPSPTATVPGLRPVAKLRTAIGQILDLPPGETVGYGATYCTRGRERVGVLSLGYADGLPRSATGAHVRVGGVRVPLIGRISMDAATVLLPTPLGESAPHTATVFGEEQNDLYELAEVSGTIPYEILSRLGPRIDRKYFYEGHYRDSDPP